MVQEGGSGAGRLCHTHTLVRLRQCVHAVMLDEDGAVTEPGHTAAGVGLLPGVHPRVLSRVLFTPSATTLHTRRLLPVCTRRLRSTVLWLKALPQ